MEPYLQKTILTKRNEITERTDQTVPRERQDADTTGRLTPI